jgi:hypothetical protein
MSTTTELTASDVLRNLDITELLGHLDLTASAMAQVTNAIAKSNATKSLASRTFAVQSLGGSTYSLAEVAQAYRAFSVLVGRKVEKDSSVTYRLPVSFGMAVSAECYDILLSVAEEVGADVFKRGADDLEKFAIDNDRFEDLVGWIETSQFFKKFQ